MARRPAPGEGPPAPPAATDLFLKQPQSAAPRGLGAFALALSAAWLLVLAYVAFAALPYNPIRLPGANAVRLQVFAPEGWAFFTRSPRQDRAYVFALHGGRWRSALLTPHSRPSNAFGLDRRSRAQGVEMGMLMDQLAPGALGGCRGELVACVSRAPFLGTIRNPSPEPTLCGPVGVALQPPVPWAWSRARTPVNMPARVGRVEVAC